MCIVFEMLGTNLYDHLKIYRFSGMQLNTVRLIALQLLESLSALRKHKIVHCDLKPENVLFSDNNKSDIKIIDFGSSCFEDK